MENDEKELKSMKEDLVSVIVPIYNASKYLINTIECIINQSYKNLEIILLNDGSTDDSLGICNLYKNKDSRIIVIDKENTGQADSRNVGIKACTGKYIYFADSDDEMDPQLIETAVKGIEESNSDLYIFNYYHTYEKEDGSKSNCKERDFIEGDYKFNTDKEKLKFITNTLLSYGCGFEVWNRLYKSDIIRNNSICFPLMNPVIAEDLCFNLFYIMHANSLKVTNKRLYYYLYRYDSTMGADREKVRVNQYNYLSKCLYDYLNSINYDYMIKNYCVIHIRLLYHELMNVPEESLKQELNKIEDSNFNKSRLKEASRRPGVFVDVMGFLKGMKYYLLSMHYNSKD